MRFWTRRLYHVDVKNLGRVVDRSRIVRAILRGVLPRNERAFSRHEFPKLLPATACCACAYPGNGHGWCGTFRRILHTLDARPRDVEKQN